MVRAAILEGQSQCWNAEQVLRSQLLTAIN